jgi:hypothetical protein
MFDEKAGHA